MERLTSQSLFENKRRVTRSEISRIRDVFPFLQLPAELRNMIYCFAIGLDSLDGFFDSQYQYLLKYGPSKTDRRRKLVRYMTTPTIFLVNKQIYQEASYQLRKQGIEFHHGLVERDLSQIISPHVLRLVSSIEITDKGHHLTTCRQRGTSWFGQMNLMKQLAELLSTGDHNLRKLTIAFDCPGLVEHMTKCHHRSVDCGFRDHMSRAVATLGDVRGVGEVILRGLNVDEAATLKKKMESRPVKFFDFPREVRDMVYKYAADWSDVSAVLKRTFDERTDLTQCLAYPKRSTPTILLLNKQIWAEATTILEKEPLNLAFPCYEDPAKYRKALPNILLLISRRTLKRVTTIHMDMQSWEWVYNLDSRTIKALAASSKLKHFSLSFKDNLKAQCQASDDPAYPDSDIAFHLGKLTAIRGLESATFQGDLPLVYTEPMAAIMTSRPATSLQKLPTPKAILPNGEVVGIQESADVAQESRTE